MTTATSKQRWVRILKVSAILAAALGGYLCSFLVAAEAFPHPAESDFYPMAGAPADPVVEARWNYYRNYAQATALLKKMAAAHPDLCRLESLGRSHGGREMWLLRITNFGTLGEQPDLVRPAFWIDGGIHANELQAVDVVLYTAWFLTEMHQRNPAIDRLLEERVFYLLPMMSPDSRDAHMFQPNSTHSPRSGQIPVDDDRDGLVDEDGPDDLDGDGHITQMRRRDPNGRYKPHPEFPALLVRCEPEEAGMYELLGEEGSDEDDDGLANEDGDGYYDPNRDWAWQWQPRYVQRGAGHYPFSIPENRLVADFVMEHANIGGAQSYHNTGGMILRGPGVKGEAWPAADLAVYQQIAKRGVEILPGYESLNTADDLYEVFGGEHDWFFAMQGVFAFTNELNTPFNMFRKKAPQRFRGSDEQRFKFNEWLLFGDGFVDWHEVNHPIFGKIEVGGMKKNWGRQPPSFLLEEECHRNMAFTLYHADQGPLVEIDAVEVLPLADGLTQITATLVNRRLTPTRSAFDVRHNLTPRDVVRLDAAELEVHVALSAIDSFFRNAKEHTTRPAEVRLTSLRSRSPAYVRWIVSGGGEATVSVQSVKGGTAAKKIDVPRTGAPADAPASGEADRDP